MKQILSLLLCLLTLPLMAQLRPVKDNIACLVGLKNDEDKWVVPAIYTTIIPVSHGFFDVLNGSKHGIINAKGICIIPPEFDNIYQLSPTMFRVQNIYKFGLIDANGKKITSVAYTNIRNDGDNFLLHEQTTDSIFSWYITKTGRILVPKTEGLLGFFEGRAVTAIGRTADFDNTILGNAALIDTTGRLLTARAFDGIRPCGSEFIVKKNGRIGKLSATGEILVEPQFGMITKGYAQSSIPCLYGNNIYEVIDGEKKGLINGQFEVIIPPIYDEITVIYPYLQSPIGHYVVRKNDKYGLLDSKGKLTIPYEYDTLVPTGTAKNIHSSNYNETITYLIRKDEKFGLIDDQGKIVVAPNFKQFIKDVYVANRLYFINGRNVSHVIAYNDSLNVKQLKLLTTTDSILLFALEGKVLPFITDKQQPNLIKHTGSQNSGYYTVGPYTILRFQDRVRFFNQKGIEWAKNKIKFIDTQRGYYVEILTISNKRGLLHPKTGKLIIDTAYTSIDQTQWSTNNLWAEKTQLINNTETRSYFIFDTLGRRKTPIVFDKRFYGIDTIVARSKGKAGIISANYKWVIEPIYSDIQQIHSSLYLVKNENGKQGLIDLQKGWKSELSYTDFRPIYAEVPWNESNFNLNNTTKNTTWWLLSTPTKRLLVSNIGDHKEALKSDTEKWNKLQDQLISLAFKPNNYANGAFKISISDSCFQKLQAASHLGFVYHYFLKDFTRLDSITSDTRTKQSLFNDLSSETIYENFFVVSATKNSVSLEKSTFQRFYPMGEEYSGRTIAIYENYLWKNHSIIPLRLNQIFGTNELLESMIVEAIKRRNDLFLDCSAPGSYVEQVAENFSLHTDGIHVYLSQYARERVELIIPISDLKEHSECRWILDYL